MEIKLNKISIREIFKGYVDNEEEGVFGYNGKLNIRPKYQREFVYHDEERDEVIRTIQKDFPLNIMYWVKNADGTFELLDGQQRTISFCKYINNDFSINRKFFNNLTAMQQKQILDYKLSIYICDGTDEEKLEWFQIVNIVGKPLVKQEIRNAVYCGSWVTDAKKFFSKTNCPAYIKGKEYIDGIPINQVYLEKILTWIVDKQKDKYKDVEDYMSKHQHDENSKELQEYFLEIIDWVKKTFVNYRKIMKKINWGILYNEFWDKKIDENELEKEIDKLMRDDEIENKTGIYRFVLSRNEKYLNLRSFNENQKLEVYTNQNGICNICKQHFEIDKMEADHITPWSEGGKTIVENCQILCKECNRRKSNK